MTFVDFHDPTSVDSLQFLLTSFLDSCNKAECRELSFSVLYLFELHKQGAKAIYFRSYDWS